MTGPMVDQHVGIPKTSNLESRQEQQRAEGCCEENGMLKTKQIGCLHGRKAWPANLLSGKE